MWLFSSGCFFILLFGFLVFQNRYVTAVMRNAESRMFGNVGKYAHWSKKVINFNAMPIVPRSRAIWRQSCSRLFQFSCIVFMWHR